MRPEYKVNAKIAILICGIVLFCSLFSLFPSQNSGLHETDALEKYIETKDSLYNSLVNDVDDYIKNSAPKSKINAQAIVDACLEHKMNLSFVLAQAQLESNFGTTGIAKKTNSVWNVNSYDGRSAEYIIKNKLGYSHPDESIIPYINLLKTKYLVNKSEEHLLQNFVSTTGHRYASNKEYEKLLNNIYKKISQSSIQSLFEEYRDLPEFV